MNSRRRKYTYIRFVTYTPRGRGRVHVHSLADRATTIAVALHLTLGRSHGRCELLALLHAAHVFAYVRKSPRRFQQLLLNILM